MPRGGKRPARMAPSGAEVWLTDPAVEDLRRLDGAPLVWALKKMLLLERDPNAGEPVLGDLIGYRKLVVGKRDWRLIWRTVTDDRGALVVEIAEIWAVGARADGEVYAEMADRVAAMPDVPVRRPLSEVVQQLGKRARGLEPKPAAIVPAKPEPWLVDRLVHTAGLDAESVGDMTSEEAVDAWTAYMMRPR